MQRSLFSTAFPPQVGCVGCPLNGRPKVLPEGPTTPQLYILGEAPGENEAISGRPFIGKAGQLLRQYLPTGYRNIARISNAARCHPEGNKTPSPKTLQHCSVFLKSDIARTKPKVILALGGTALSALYPDLTKGITTWRGRVMVYRQGTFSCWVVPAVHPSFINRSGGEKSREFPLFVLDIQKAFAQLAYIRPSVPVYDETDPYKNIVIARTEEQITANLARFAPGCPVAVDFETTNLNHYAGDYVLSAAVSDGVLSVVFPVGLFDVTLESKRMMQLCDFLFAHQGPVIVHNLNFELRWLSKFRPLADWLRLTFWDTMIVAYAEDVRRDSHSLGYQTLLRFGFNLKTKTNIDPTKWRDIPPTDFLRYNALDAQWTLRLWETQRPLPEFVKNEHNRQVPGLVFSAIHAQNIGLPIDYAALDDLQRIFTQKAADARQSLIKAAHALQNNQLFEGGFDPGSANHIKQLALCSGFKIDNTNEKTLATLSAPWVDLILQYRAYTKVNSTYLKGLRSVIYSDGRIHPYYNTAFTVTGRLSANDPNIQNFPSREFPEVRRVIVAPPGYGLLSVDYGQIEARVAVMVTQDPVLSTYFWEGLDIHQEWAERLISLYPAIVAQLANKFGKVMTSHKDAVKLVRKEIKTGFVFSQIYGASIKTCATYMGVPEAIMEKMSGEFWDKYGQVLRWQHELYKKYIKTGYVEALTGRRRGGPMSRNELYNTPIQGSALDIVARAMGDLFLLAIKEDKPWLAPVLNIHDDLSFLIPENNIEQCIEPVVKEMCRPVFDWINVPLSVEVSYGKSWYNKKNIGEYRSDQFGHKKVAPGGIAPDNLS